MKFYFHSSLTRRKLSSFVSIVIPTYQEAENLVPLVTEITKVMSPLSCPYELIVVDDNSQDGTNQTLKELAEQGHPVRLITRLNERGLSSAVIRGFLEAKGTILVCMDADLSHPPEAIPRMLDALSSSNCDMVIGSRYVLGGSTDETWSIFRVLNSKIATLLAKPFTQVKDPMSGFFALPEKVFDRAPSLNPIGYKIGLELIVKCDCSKVCEVPIHFANRKYGKSKLALREQINYLKHLKRLLDFKYGELSRLVQFVFVGSTGLVVDLTVLSILLRILTPFTIARGFAIWVALTWNFWLNRRLTFSYSRKGNILGQYLRFVISCILGAAISWAVSVSFVQTIGFFSYHPLLAALIGVVTGTCSNYLLSRWWAFRLKVSTPLNTATRK